MQRQSRSLSELGLLALHRSTTRAEPPDATAGSGAVNPLDRIEALLKCSKDPRPRPMDLPEGAPAVSFPSRIPQTNNAHPEFLIPATNEIIQNCRSSSPS